MSQHPNFYWLQEDYITAKSKQSDFDYTILRPQLIVGPNHGVVMNLPPVIGVFAAMLKHEGRKLSYPGGADWVWEAVDVRLRPIAMSTITTLVGLAPLVLIPGAGTELYRGVGAIVMFGIIGAALVTLTMLPALTVIVLQLRDKVLSRSPHTS